MVICHLMHVESMQLITVLCNMFLMQVVAKFLPCRCHVDL